MTPDELARVNAQAEQVARENAERDEWAESDYLRDFQHPVHAGYCRYCPHELKVDCLTVWTDPFEGFPVPEYCECGCHIF